ncbi:unnamed protein product [Mytilus coruscus]|uniref:C2H2-type domain-containing protein n=1 Tax=Mytilus coruscus TaxID=42192 RepID=A0A6J8C3X7_MYTCO|nr:unnamed protein product [Mytilus coruscus]
MINKKSLIKIKRVDFSDPQGGKCICDRKAAHITGHIKRYVNEGNNVVTADDFRKAVATMSNVKVVVCLPPDSKSDSLKCPKMESISCLNNFLYDNNSMTVWRQYDIGKGQRYPFKDIGINANTCIPAITTLSVSDLKVKQLKQKPLQHVQEGESQQIQPDKNPTLQVENASNLFSCPEDGCICTFINFGNMLRHLDIGNHTFSEQNVNLKDRVRIMYSELIETKSLQKDHVVPDEPVIETSHLLNKGWGPKGKREVKRFSVEQKDFLVQKFNQGEVTGHKYEPEEVGNEMRTAKNKDGKRIFKCCDFLTPTQIASYFSRLALKKRQNANTTFQEEDLQAEEVTNEICNACDCVALQ